MFNINRRYGQTGPGLPPNWSPVPSKFWGYVKVAIILTGGYWVYSKVASGQWRLLLVLVLITCGTLVGALALFGIWIYSIYDRVKRCPRGEMIMCHKHGPLFEKDCIQFLNVPYCPMCFHDNLKRAEKIGIENYMSQHYPGKV